MDIYPCIPVILQYGYTVCHGLPKSTTVPVPALPILENPWVFLYPCRTLVANQNDILMATTKPTISNEKMGSVGWANQRYTAKLIQRPKWKYQSDSGNEGPNDGYTTDKSMKAAKRRQMLWNRVGLTLVWLLGKTLLRRMSTQRMCRLKSHLQGL